MLRRQRTFFLSRNQYEPVVLASLGLNSGSQWFRFYHEDEATRYIIRWRYSENWGISWSNWFNSEERNISTGSYTDFSFGYRAGLSLDVCVIMVGDEKEQSEPSNVVMVIIPAQPMQSPPVIKGELYYVDGDAFAAIHLKVPFPSGVSRFALWRRELGEDEWKSNGTGSSILVRDQTSEDGKTYEYKIAWVDSDNNLLSDYSNVETISVPNAYITYLVPPLEINAEFFDLSGMGNPYDYYNRLTVHKGDLRSKGVKGQYRLNNGNWTDLATYDFEERGVSEETTSFYWWLGHTNRPTPGDVWQYRLKNYANGLDDSAWSEIFEVTVPSLLPKLASPVVTLQQTGSQVLVSWGSVENASGYRIERKLRTASEYTLIIDNLPASTTRYTDSGTWLENTYDVRVTALGDGRSYQNSNPTVESITIGTVVILSAPVIDSVVESGISIQITISNINTPNTDTVRVEMSENGGAWRDLFGVYPASSSETTVTATIPGESILEGGALRFRARALPAGMARDPSPYSEIASITIDEREWLLRWTGTEWDYCESVTGGWYCAPITDSDHTTSSSAVAATNLGNGTLRLSGAGNAMVSDGYYMTRGNLTTGNTGLNTKYRQICMIGSLVKGQEGQSYHAWFGTGWTYSFSGGTAFSMMTKTIAGSDSGRGAAGTRTDPSVSACGVVSYTNRIGSKVAFYFNSGYADIKGIYAIKR